MANHKGSEGEVKVGANTVAELTAWSLDESANTIDDSILSETVTSFQIGRTSWTGGAECFWDETDTNGQEALTIGASVTLNMYPEGSTTGDQYATGTAYVTGISMGASIDGMVTRSFTFQGTGALTWGTAA
jgi:hypothetical protein